MRLIDADAFWGQFEYGEKMLEEMARVLPTEVSKAVLEMYKELKERLDASPTIDAVPVVRCKDCKWYGRVDKRRFYRGSDCLQKRIDTIVPERDFCSRGERKES